MAEIIILSNARVSFPSLTEARVSKKFPNSPAMFSADFILAPNDPGFQEFYKRVVELAQEAWKEQAGPILQLIMTDRKAKCFGNGAEKINETTMQPLIGYTGNIWINAKNKNQPQMIRPDGAPATSTMESMNVARSIYGGCYANVALKPWIRTANRGVSCDLVAIQFMKDGEPFGEGATAASGMFAPVAAAPGGVPSPAGMAFPGLPSFMS